MEFVARVGTGEGEIVVPQSTQASAESDSSVADPQPSLVADASKIVDVGVTAESSQ